MTFDLSDPGLLLRADVLDDPGPLYDVLRREAPVWQIPGQDTFLVSDPRLIRDAVGRPDDFSSNLVSLLHDDGSRCPVAYPIAPFRDPIHVLSTADPPLHTQHRRLLQSHLSPATVAGFGPVVTTIVEEHLAGALSAERVDVVATFSDPVPARAICEVIGLPSTDAPDVLRFTYGLGPLLDGVTLAEEMASAMTSAIELAVFVQGRLDAALQQPAGERPGLLAVLAEGIEDGALTRDDARNILVVLVTAGSETTASLIATAVETLARDTELQTELRRHPERIPDAIEDILRADGPFQFHYRHTPTDTSLGGISIPAQSRVLLMWAAANRDAPNPPSAPSAPSDGPPARGPAPHFAFGRGLHFCIGAPVARLETRIAVEQLLARTTSISLDPDRPPTRRPSIFIRRHASLPVVVRS